MSTNIKCLIIIETKRNQLQYGVHLGLLIVQVNMLNTPIKDDRFKNGAMVFLSLIQYIKTDKKDVLDIRHLKLNTIWYTLCTSWYDKFAIDEWYIT